MEDNLILLTFEGRTNCIADISAWRYDYGQVAVFTDLELDDVFEVHISNYKRKGLAQVLIGTNNRVEIPYAYFEDGNPVYGWVFVHPTLDSGETAYSFVIPVKDRPAPDPSPIIPEPNKSAISAAVNLLYNTLNQTAQDVTDSGKNAAKAAQSALDAAGSADEAELSADRAEQYAAKAGYLFFHIEDGDLMMERTPNTQVNFRLDDGDLILEEEVI